MPRARLRFLELLSTKFIHPLSGEAQSKPSEPPSCFYQSSRMIPMDRRLSLLPLLALFASASAQESIFKETTARPTFLNPAKVDFSDGFASRLRAPRGFKVSLWAKGLNNPRMMLPLPDGTVLVSLNGPGQIVALKDTNGDGTAETPTVALDGKPGVHGLTRKGDDIYFATVTEVWTARMGPDMRLQDVRKLTGMLPEGGQHARRTLAFGPDGKLYIGVGSRTNDRPAAQPEDACLMRMNADGSGLEVFAKGLRNTMGFGFSPVDGKIWGFDHGTDYRGNDIPNEELNVIEEGKHYGWPYVWGQQKVDPLMYQIPKGFKSLEEFAATTAPSQMLFTAHSAPIAMLFHSGTGWAEAKNDVFVTFRGSWNRDPAVGYKVMRVRFDAAGNPTKSEDFLTGFLSPDGKSYLGRPAGIAQLADGSLLVGDDTNGAIYRVSLSK
ncbi:sorbosone dehydrogenase family protein [bacterium]|nr:MAG: sorbosone dehydrogenase family protein [bacterium]